MTIEMLKQQPPIIHEPAEKATSSLIWLHGLGANAHDFEGIMHLLPVAENQLRLIFPNAPVRPVTINQGMEMQAWYDIKDLELRQADKDGIEHSSAYINDLIDAEVNKGIAGERILIAGFSQGGAMALYSGLQSQHKLGGLIGLSCYLLNPDNSNASRNNHNTPILIAHGTYDPVVNYQLGEEAASTLSQQDYKVTFLSYPIQHEVSLPEIESVSGWINQRLK